MVSVEERVCNGVSCFHKFFFARTSLLVCNNGASTRQELTAWLVCYTAVIWVFNQHLLRCMTTQVTIAEATLYFMD